SVHGNLKQEIDRLGVEGFSILNNEIRSSNGGEIFYKGLARNITSLKSLAGVKRLWIEEGESVSKNSLKVLTPSIRSSAADNNNNEDPPEIWITMNRGHSTGAIAQKYLKRAEASLRKTGRYEDDLIMVVQLNWRDNPWFPPELEQERRDDYENLSRAEYDSIWENAYDDTVEGAIIKPEWFDAAVDAHKLDRLKKVFTPHGAKVAAHDPFDDGNDAGGYTLRHGSIIKYVKSKDSGEIDEVCDWATDLAISHGADWFVWDGDGMGTGLKRQVSLAFNGTHTKYHIFKGSLSGKGQDNANQIYMPDSDDKNTRPKTYAETFKNNRAQFYSELARRFYNTYKCVVKGEYLDPDDMISIDSEGVDNLAELKVQTCKIPKKRNNSGLVQIMSKQDMKVLEIESPNETDSIMMSLFSPKADVSNVELNFTGWGH
ncbi:MAG: phage terminase large subunit, partial [Gammaproteobacteria bacterium]|nr:phage terminase large subunit [Gammaproteobacteria bacterium]